MKILIKYTFHLAEKLISGASIADIITLQKIFDRIKKVLDFNLNIENNFFTQSLCKMSNDLYGDLSQSGFYSLIYDDRSIFNEILSYFLQYNLKYIEKLSNNLKKNKISNIFLSLDGLSSIGYGLFFFKH